MIRFEKVSFEEFRKSCKNDINSNYFGYNCDLEKKIKQYYDDIKLPERSTSGSAGYDFFAPFDFTFFQQYDRRMDILCEEDQFLYPTGIRFVTDRDDIVLLCMPKSGLGCKYGMRLKNTIGVIDSDYLERQRLKAPGTIMENIAYWDEAIWDDAYWQGEPRVSQDWTTISHCVGKAMSMRLKIISKGHGVALVGFDLITQSGGMI